MSLKWSNREQDCVPHLSFVPILDHSRQVLHSQVLQKQVTLWLVHVHSCFSLEGTALILSATLTFLPNQPTPALWRSSTATLMVARLSWPKRRQQQQQRIPAQSYLADTDLSSDVDGGVSMDALDTGLASEEAQSAFKPQCR